MQKNIDIPVTNHSNMNPQSRLQFNAYDKSVFIKNIKESMKDSKITN